MEISHCDDYIEDPTTPAPLRDFLRFQRQPAAYKGDDVGPTLFATYTGDHPSKQDKKGRRCRVVMASRMGDVGIKFKNMDKPNGYEWRVDLSELSDFGVLA